MGRCTRRRPCCGPHAAADQPQRRDVDVKRVRLVEKRMPPVHSDDNIELGTSKTALPAESRWPLCCWAQGTRERTLRDGNQPWEYDGAVKEGREGKAHTQAVRI
jgi:hypothetical protein